MSFHILHVFRSLDVLGALDIGVESKIGPFDFPAGNFYLTASEALKLANAIDGHEVGCAPIVIYTSAGCPLIAIRQSKGAEGLLSMRIEDPDAECRLDWTFSGDEAERLSRMIRNEIRA
jgi:hypothetical protein